MRQVRVTYRDGTVATFAIKDTAFGTEGVEAHGPVMRATIGEWIDESDGSAFPRPNRLTRSLRSGGAR